MAATPSGFLVDTSRQAENAAGKEVNQTPAGRVASPSGSIRSSSFWS